MSSDGPIPLADLKAQYRSIKAEIDAAVAAVLDSGQYVRGDALTNFERAFAQRCGAKHAVGTSCGTAALHVALLAAGIGPGHEVLVPAQTFVATAEAVVQAGAKPVFVDVDPATLCLDPTLIERALSPATRAIIPVHLYGQMSDMDPILELSRQHGLIVIEDAAQAVLARHGDRSAGSLGTLACFSFFPSKNLGGCGDGGMVVTDDDGLAQRLRMLIDHGRREKDRHIFIGYNYRLDPLQAAILSVKLRHLDGWTRARKVLAGRYDELLAGSPLHPLERRRDHVYQLYVVRTPQRDALAEALRGQGIGVGIHYPSGLHLQPAFEPYRPSEPLPVTERAAHELLSLPLFPELTGAQQRRVVRAATAFFDRR